ncbi:Uncharacterised protein [Mycobacteroides abscessus subsp. abscessus]|nr:Uncharacterised protein [Mycobacteroides abscessus subsp. abscessus]
MPQRLGLTGTVHDLPDHPSGELAVHDLQNVGRHEIQGQLVGQGVDHLTESTRNHAARVPQPTQGPDGGAGTWSEYQFIGDILEHRLGQTGQRGHALM